MTKGSEREYVLKILEDIHKKEIFANQALDDYFYVYEFDKQQRSFISRIVYGTIENNKYIDFCINAVAKIKVNKMKPTIRFILRMSVYQLLYMDKVPSHAAINEAVKLTTKRNFFQLKGFVNGVLRSVERRSGEFEGMLDELPMRDKLSIKYSLNWDVVGYLQKQYSDEVFEAFLQESLKRKKTCIRVNTLKTSSEELRKILKTDCEISDGHLLDTSMYLSGYSNLTSIEGFTNGLFQVQDESSTLVGLVANPSKDQSIIDVCAAPGGKSTHIAQLLANEGKVISCDVSESKVEKINENISRLDLSNVETMVQDASESIEANIENFDLVIADIPCSGLGLLRSKPDIKSNMTVAKIKSLIELQKEIIDNVSTYVKPGGTLIYSTCTINKKENRVQVDEFLDRHHDFDLVPIVIGDMASSEDINPFLDEFIQDGCIELMTNEKVTDGFFIAKMKRRQ